MTTVVVTKEGILADCQLTATINVMDWDGKKHVVDGLINAYCKIGIENTFADIQAYAAFGEMETARKLFNFIKAVGLVRLPEAFKATVDLGLRPPHIPTGIVWLNTEGEVHSFEVCADKWQVQRHDGPVCFGTGRDHFVTSYKKSGNVLSAFLDAILLDPRSSSYVYDHYLFDTNELVRREGKHIRQNQEPYTPLRS